MDITVYLLGALLEYPTTTCFQWGHLKNDPHTYQYVVEMVGYSKTYFVLCACFCEIHPFCHYGKSSQSIEVGSRGLITQENVEYMDKIFSSVGFCHAFCWCSLHECLLYFVHHVFWSTLLIFFSSYFCSVLCYFSIPALV